MDLFGSPAERIAPPLKRESLDDGQNLSNGRATNPAGGLFRAAHGKILAASRLKQAADGTKQAARRTPDPDAQQKSPASGDFLAAAGERARMSPGTHAIMVTDPRRRIDVAPPPSQHMTDLPQPTETDALEARAYDAFDRGELDEAARLFSELATQNPDVAYLHYMLGLAHKYRRDWPASLRHNLRAQALREKFDESFAWNAGIAATALGDWGRAREQWRQCGIRIPEGGGPIEDDFGLVSIRLNPWANGETVFARRIDVVRARLLNVPLPESGHRLFDIVLHDGAKTGERTIEDGVVPVFNALARLTPSDYRTYVTFVSCESPADIEELENATLPGIGYVEDWTGSVVHYCLRCSYGTAHRHTDDAEEPEWNPDRNLGIGSQSKAAVTRLLEEWAARAPHRHVDGIESPNHAPPEPEQASAWWRGPDEDEDTDEGV